MRRFIRVSTLPAIVFGLLGVAGCNMEYPVNEKFNWTMKPGEVKWYTNETGTSSQKNINVTMKPQPSDGNIAVGIVLAEDFEASKEAMKKGGEPPKYLGLHPGGGPVDMTFVTMAKQPFTVILHNRHDETISVELKVSSSTKKKANQ
jgi:hypothetical protein